MAKKSFWQALKDYFKEDEVHIITDEEWEQMQATEAEKAAADDTPLEEENGWRCPECHRMNEAGSQFCSRCGYHPGGFENVAARMTDEHIQLVLRGSIRYPADQLRLLENELARRKNGDAAPEAPAEAAAGWTCPRCKAQNPEEEYFCAQCGEYRF